MQPYQIIFILHSGPSHLDKHGHPSLLGLFEDISFCPSAPHWPARSHMMVPSGHRVKESVHVLLGDVSPVADTPDPSLVRLGCGAFRSEQRPGKNEMVLV